MRTGAARRDNRYATRVDLKVEAQLRELGSANRFEVHIEDLSLTGARFATHFRLATGQAVTIALPGLAPLHATIAWRDGLRYGAAFDRALHVAVFDHLIGRRRTA